MAKAKVQYTCTECSHTVAKWVGRCPSCGAWSTMEEGVPARAATGVAANVGLTLPKTRAVPITKIDPNSTRALPVGIGELDRVLGGGIVPGSVILLAGEPGFEAYRPEHAIWEYNLDNGENRVAYASLDYISAAFAQDGSLL